MNKSYSKIIHIIKSNLILERRRLENILNEGENDPIVIDSTKKDIIKTSLWDEIKKMPQFEKEQLGLDFNHTQNLSIPHSIIDVGVKIPLSDIFKNY